MPYLFLVLAITSEVLGTLALRSAEGFTRFGPSLIAILGYGLAFYFLSLSLKDLSTGFAYAVWAGIGIVLVAIGGIIIYGEKIDLGGLVGFSLIITGVVVLNVFSNTQGH